MPTPDEDDTAGPRTDAARLIANRYRLEDRIGGGAMGTVWAGTDELLRRPVAVKEVQLPPGMPEQEADELRERALREARAIAVLTHPNVVTLYDVARHDNEPFVVMELVPSQSLTAVLNRHGTLTGPQLALTADGIAAALETAHRNGIVHRDVKPGNVLISDEGRIKLTDFGISRNVSEQTITQTGIMLGTPAFIAPEVAAGEPVTAAADLWGLGATLFAAAEGRAPYDSDNDPVATVASVVRDPAPRPTGTGAIAEVITGLMAKDPMQRMSLAQVRRHVGPLLPTTGTRPFEMLVDPEKPTVRVQRPADAAAPRATGNVPAGTFGAGPTGAEVAGAGAPQLADDPGPLPFQPKDPPPPPRRSRWPGVLLGLAAAVVFAATTAGGFAATRTLAGHSLLPGSRAKTAAPLISHRDYARLSADKTGGQFAIPVPSDWTAFHGERTSPATSMEVTFVSPDGTEEVGVERFGGFFRQSHDLDQYLRALPERAAGTNGHLAMITTTASGQSDATSGVTGKHLTYDTTQHSVAGSAGRSVQHRTISELIPRDGDLWVVRVTVGAQQTSQGQALFDKILPGFDTVG